MVSFDTIKKIKEEKEKEWITFGSVTGVDIGDKLVNGSRIPNTVIRVFVDQKQELGKLPNDSELIPPTAILDKIADNKLVIKKLLVSLEHIDDCSKFYPVASTNLLSHFNKAGYYLSENARIKKENSNDVEIWHIIDDTAIQAYMIRKDKDSGILDVYEAVRTDVIEQEFVQFQQVSASANDKSDEEKKKEKEKKKEEDKRKKPVYYVNKKPKGGDDEDDDTDGAGTLGVIVKEKGSEPKEGMMLLSCYHVFDKDLAKAKVEKEESDDKKVAKKKHSFDGSMQKTGKRLKAIKQYQEPNDPSKQASPVSKGTISDIGLDCAAIGVGNSEEYSSEIIRIGRVRKPAKAEKGMEVRKYGNATGLTYGIVDSINLTVKIGKGTEQKIYYNQIGIVVDLTRNAKFGYNGDSGSLVVNNNLNAIGLLFVRSSSAFKKEDQGDQAGDNSKTNILDNMDGMYCAATPIQAVLDALGVEIYDEPLENPLDKDIDDSMKTKVMYPPPLSEGESMFTVLFGDEICCCRCP